MRPSTMSGSASFFVTSPNPVPQITSSTVEVNNELYAAFYAQQSNYCSREYHKQHAGS